MGKPGKLNLASFLTLIAANGLAIWQFSTSGGVILEILWIYWLQSVVIGIINVWRILTTPVKVTLPQNTPAVSGLLNPDNTAGPLIRVGCAVFFTIHYGIFHLVYVAFLTAFSSSGVSLNGFAKNGLTTDNLFAGAIDVGWVIISGLVFALHHVLTFFSERHQLKLHPDEAPDIKEVMGRPYRRILPMHMIIIFGPIIASLFGNVSLFAVFMILKTIADLSLFYQGASHPGTLSAATVKP